MEHCQLSVPQINENFGLVTANETNHWQLFASNITRELQLPFTKAEEPTAICLLQN